jgi:hypothetical protein
MPLLLLVKMSLTFETTLSTKCGKIHGIEDPALIKLRELIRVINGEVGLGLMDIYGYMNYLFPPPTQR